MGNPGVHFLASLTYPRVRTYMCELCMPVLESTPFIYPFGLWAAHSRSSAYAVTLQVQRPPYPGQGSILVVHPQCVGVPHSPKS